MNEMQPLSLTISPWSWRLRMTKETKFDQNSSFQTYRFYSINPFQWRELVYLIIYLPHSFIRLYKCLIGTQYLSQNNFHCSLQLIQVLFSFYQRSRISIAPTLRNYNICASNTESFILCGLPIHITPSVYTNSEKKSSIFWA